MSRAQTIRAAKRVRSTKGGRATPPAVGVRHLRRECRDALELALVALAPAVLTERLASAAGLLEALAELPRDSNAFAALTEQLRVRAATALGEWREWEALNLAQG